MRAVRLPVSRRLRPSVVLLALALSCLWMLVGAATGSAKTRVYVAEFKGTISLNSADDAPSGNADERGSMTFDIKGYADVGADGRRTTHTTLVAQGTYYDAIPNGDQTVVTNCTIHQASGPYTGAITVGPPYAGAGSAVPDGSFLSVSGGCPTDDMTSRGYNACQTSGCGFICAEQYASGDQGTGPGTPYADFYSGFDPTVSEYPKSGSKTYHFSGTLKASGACFKGTQTTTETITSSLTLGGGQPSSPGPPRRRPPRHLTKAEIAVKRDALDDLKTTWEKALYPCGVAYASIPLALLGPGGASIAVLISGTLAGVSTSLCAVYVETIVDDINTVSDPPLSSYQRLAQIARARGPSLRLPDCRRLPGAQRTLCQRLRADALGLFATARQTASVASALEITISRESGAERAHDAGAARRQDQHLRSLSTPFERARKAERTAGTRLAGLLQSAGLQLPVAPARWAGGLQTLIGRVGRRGASRARIGSADQKLLVAGSIDWLSALRSG